MTTREHAGCHAGQLYLWRLGARRRAVHPDRLGHQRPPGAWFDKPGVPTVTIGAGPYEIHTVNEYVDLPEFANGCRLAVALATLEG